MNIDNSYIDKMFCHNCKHCKKCYYDKNLCKYCGKTMFSDNTINVYTPTIPPRYGYSYNFWPSHVPFVWYYGSYRGKLLNYR